MWPMNNPSFKSKGLSLGWRWKNTKTDIHFFLNSENFSVSNQNLCYPTQTGIWILVRFISEFPFLLKNNVYNQHCTKVKSPGIIQFYFLDIFYSTVNNLKQHLYIKAHIPQDRIFKKIQNTNKLDLSWAGCSGGEPSLIIHQVLQGLGNYALIPSSHENSFSERTEHKINTWLRRKTWEWEAVNTVFQFIKRVKMQPGIVRTTMNGLVIKEQHLNCYGILYNSSGPQLLLLIIENPLSYT